MRNLKLKTVLKVCLIALCSFLALLFEGWWPLDARIFGQMPDMAICLTVVLSSFFGRKKGSVIGLILGLVHDAMFVSIFYAGPLVCMLIGYTVGSLSERTKQQLNAKTSLVVLAVEAAAHLIRILGELIVRSRSGIAFSIFAIFPIQTLLTFGFTMIGLLIVRFITAKKHKEEKKQRYQSELAAERYQRG